MGKRRAYSFISSRLAYSSQIAVTLQDWEEFPLQFEKSTNYLEKAFYKLLTSNGGIVQTIVEDLRVSAYIDLIFLLSPL